MKSFDIVLTPQEICDGMNLAITNAHRLAEDAKHLFANNSIPSAFYLSILAIEEEGKVSLLRGMALLEDKKEIKNFWNDFRSHTKKNAAWILVERALQGARSLDDLADIYNEKSDHSKFIESTKQQAIYSDFIDGKWLNPTDAISNELAAKLVMATHIMCRKKQPISLLELDLWVKHMKPVRHLSLNVQKTALIAWEQDMIVHGLKEPSDNDMKRFVNEGLIFPGDNSNTNR